MNRRALLSWLPALPWAPKALGEPAAAAGMSVFSAKNTFTVPTGVVLKVEIGAGRGGGANIIEAARASNDSSVMESAINLTPEELYAFRRAWEEAGYCRAAPPATHAPWLQGVFGTDRGPLARDEWCPTQDDWDSLENVR